jgi:hypothetical protein
MFLSSGVLPFHKCRIGDGAGATACRRSPIQQAAHSSFIQMLLNQRAVRRRFQSRTTVITVGGTTCSKSGAACDREPPDTPRQAFAARWGGAMVIRRAQRGPMRGSQFYGCARFPAFARTGPYPERVYRNGTIYFRWMTTQLECSRVVPTLTSLQGHCGLTATHSRLKERLDENGKRRLR